MKQSKAPNNKICSPNMLFLKFRLSKKAKKFDKISYLVAMIFTK